ncbi:unannotated protein [freshwater metagenome]|uniref:Unannotated protein n=1 Tax=freshwater metagenome TaxID=449393 RepID=A0A6J6EFR1_9ZZZZ
MRTKTIDMCDRAFQVIDEGDIDVERSVLGRPTLITRRHHRDTPRLGDLDDFTIGVDADSGLNQRFERFRYEIILSRSMYQQSLCCVADARPLNLGVDDDWDCLLLVSARIEVDMTDASTGLDRGDLCFFDDGANEITASTWDDEIDKASSMEKGTDRISVIAWDQCDEICAQPRLFGRFPHQRDQDLI